MQIEVDFAASDEKESTDSFCCFEASSEVDKLFRFTPDVEAEAEGLLRVIDEMEANPLIFAKP